MTHPCRAHESQKSPHRTALSNEALGLLVQLKPLSSGSEYVFPSRINRNEPLNPQTANAALKRIGYGVNWWRMAYALSLVAP